MKFYLSGGMEFKTNLGIKWRDWITAELAQRKHTTVDPTKLEEDSNIKGPVQYHITQLKIDKKLDEVRKIVRESLFRKDTYGIKLSDSIIVFYDLSVQKGAGTLSESWEAFRTGKPVYVITDFPMDKIPSWLIGETTALFDSFEEFLAYTEDIEQLEKDIENAQRIAKEVFAGM